MRGADLVGWMLIGWNLYAVVRIGNEDVSVRLIIGTIVLAALTICAEIRGNPKRL